MHAPITCISADRRRRAVCRVRTWHRSTVMTCAMTSSYFNRRLIVGSHSGGRQHSPRRAGSTNECRRLHWRRSCGRSNIIGNYRPSARRCDRPPTSNARVSSSWWSTCSHRRRGHGRAFVFPGRGRMPAAAMRARVRKGAGRLHRRESILRQVQQRCSWPTVRIARAGAYGVGDGDPVFPLHRADHPVSPSFMVMRGHGFA